MRVWQYKWFFFGVVIDDFICKHWFTKHLHTVIFFAWYFAWKYQINIRYQSVISIKWLISRQPWYWRSILILLPLKPAVVLCRSAVSSQSCSVTWCLRLCCRWWRRDATVSTIVSCPTTPSRRKLCCRSMTTRTCVMTKSSLDSGDRGVVFCESCLYIVGASAHTLYNKCVYVSGCGGRTASSWCVV